MTSYRHLAKLLEEIRQLEAKGEKLSPEQVSELRQALVRATKDRSRAIHRRQGQLRARAREIYGRRLTAAAR